MTERETPSVDGLVIGILGGTGEQGRGLAKRFAMAEHLGDHRVPRPQPGPTASPGRSGWASVAWPTTTRPGRRTW